MGVDSLDGDQPGGDGGLVASHEGAEACICDLNAAFDLSQPTISHHMKVLHEAGLVDRDKRGVWVYYRVRPQALAALIGCLVP
jgi:ArsR family transcriptional regulator